MRCTAHSYLGPARSLARGIVWAIAFAAATAGVAAADPAADSTLAVDPTAPRPAATASSGGGKAAGAATGSAKAASSTERAGKPAAKKPVAATSSAAAPPAGAPRPGSSKGVPGVAPLVAPATAPPPAAPADHVAAPPPQPAAPPAALPAPLPLPPPLGAAGLPPPSKGRPLPLPSAPLLPPSALAGRAAAAATAPSKPAPPLPPRVERRQVALIDLVGDEEAAALSRTFAAELVRHRELAPLADASIAATLIGPLSDEDSAAIEAARRALADAGDALARFELSVAAARALAGQAELNNVQPTAAATRLYAELAFVHGQAKLSDGDGPAARSSFLLTQRLAPDWALDPARYLPDVIAAFRQARRSGGGRVPLQIRGQGTAYVDGQLAGAAPLSLEVAPGAHVVHLFGPNRLARGARIEVTPTSPAVVVLPDARASLPVIVARGRRAAAAAADPTALTTAVAQLARLIGVSDVVVLSRGTDGVLTAQAWRDRPPGAGRIHGASGGDVVAAALLDLAPPSAEELRPPPPLVVPRQPEPLWYQRRWVQVSLVSGALAVIATALVIATADDASTVGVNPDPEF